MKNNKEFSEFVNRKICFLYSKLQECEGTERFYFILSLKALLSDISIKYISFSDYIPLKLIAEELIKEREALCFITNGSIYSSLRKNKVRKLFENLLENKRGADTDKQYIALLLKAEKFTAAQIRRMKRTADSEFKSILSEMEKSSISRIKRLNYLLSV